MAATRDVGGDPPESTRLRIGDDVAWSDVGGVYDRDDSLKENTNPKCLLKNLHHAGGGGGASQRFSGNLKPTAAPIIGISGNLGQGGGARRHHHHNHHPPAMFPKKAKTGGGGRNPKPAVPEREPNSPKVSCIGKVLSDRERARRSGGGGGGRPPRPPGCCPGLGFFARIRRSRSRRSAVESVDWSPPPPPPASAAAARRRSEEEATAAAPAPALGGMRRFASGRRAADWTAEMETDGRVARSGPL